MAEASLPPDVHFIRRDWLSANHVLLLRREDNVLIDTGYGSRFQDTLALLQRPEHLGASPLHRIVNTHAHSDHIGGNAALRRVYDCAIAVPAAEAPLIEAWDQRALWLDVADQHAERFDFDGVIEADQNYRWGGLDWQAIAAPGHDMGALVFYCVQARVLISGDALWERGFGMLMPGSSEALRSARATLETIAKLDIEMVIPGHGAIFTDIDAALQRSFQRLEAFEADPLKVARHALKVMLMFMLLDRGRFPLSKLPAYLDRIAFYREWNAAYLGLSAADLAHALVEELARSGAVRRSGGFVLPAAE